jgi:acyl carrier protein
LIYPAADGKIELRNMFDYRRLEAPRMTEAEILARVREIVSEKLGIPEEDITPESNFVEDLGADSLYLNEIVYDLEEEFNMRVPDSDFDVLRTVGQAVTYIHSRVHGDS